MSVQDLTPQLRTRLGRIERVVGIFVALAVILMALGFTYYLYTTGIRKGWWVKKVTYYTFLQSGAGLKIGDKVLILGFPRGEITGIDMEPPESTWGNVFVKFSIQDPYFGYIWDDSEVRIVGDLLGNRSLEITKGGASGKTDLHPTYQTKGKEVVGIWDPKAKAYIPLPKENKGYYLSNQESVTINDRLDNVAKQIESALPSLFALTNTITAVVANLEGITSEAKVLLAGARPLLTNITAISSTLTNGPGALGEWIIPTNINSGLTATLAAAEGALTNASLVMLSTDSNVTKLATSLDDTLISFSYITSNLNAQVQANTNILSEISSMIISADELMQGLKKHWLLRSAFKGDKPAEEEAPAGEKASRPPPPRAGKWR
jgi:hypothetical protein